MSWRTCLTAGRLDLQSYEDSGSRAGMTKTQDRNDKWLMAYQQDYPTYCRLTAFCIVWNLEFDFWNLNRLHP